VLYCERNLVERFFNKIKRYPAIATRYDKLAQDFLAAGPAKIPLQPNGCRAAPEKGWFLGRNLGREKIAIRVSGENKQIISWR
jgi:hypothetical protein